MTVARRIGYIICMMLVCLFSACDKEEKGDLTFIGDSLVARWDLDEYFPHYEHTNLGLGGSGIDYVAQTTAGHTYQNLIVLTGTNDSHCFTPEAIDGYVSKYIDIISSIDAETVYLYSVLPRQFTGDNPEINDKIRNFNMMVKNGIADIPHIVYLDAFDLFMRGSEINPALYSDRLHLSRDGYEILTSLLKSKL